MLWFILGILSGLFNALGATVAKHTLKQVNNELVAFASVVFTLPFLLLALFRLDFAETNFTFWWAAFASAAFSVIGLILYYKALAVGELSLTMPFLSFTPVFLIFTSWVMLKEFPSPLGIFGIFLIVAGAYVLEFKKDGGILGPFKCLLNNKGAQLMLLVAVIYAVSSNFNKIAIVASNPITYLIWSELITVLLFLPLIYRRNGRGFPKAGSEIKANFKFFLLIGLFAAITLLAQMTALVGAIVPYVISLKRTSALFSVFLGVLVFGEKNIKKRLLGAFLMVLGVFLIAIG